MAEVRDDLAKELVSIRDKLGDLTEEVIKLRTINELQRHSDQQNVRRIDQIDMGQNQAKGVLALVRWGGIPLIISICGMFWQFNNGLNSIEQRMAIVEMKINRMDKDIASKQR